MTFDFRNRVLLLDGAMGTMIQRHHLSDADYKGDRFRDIPCLLKGCHDILSLTRPDIISSIHREYLEAGADIITTNSFNANEISLADYGLSELAYEIARESARLARREADKFCALTPSKPRFVAGTLGPTNKTASISGDIMNPATRDITFEQLRSAYHTQIEGLLDGGADIILIETVFDTLNAKAALFALQQIRDERNIDIPVMVSATISDSGGRTLSGQTLEAFYASVSHAGLLSVGLNCAFGPSQLLTYIERLDKTAECLISCHPNAGLPNELGEYDEDPATFAVKIREFLKNRYVNIIGGCCGTTPEHIRLIADFIEEYEPRPIPERKHLLTVSNLEPLTVSAERNFINIGERTNVAGSAKFARLIREGLFEEAVSIGRRQIEAGAQIIDICMDAPLIDGAAAMQTFVRLIGSDPEISRVPVMIDSSDWNVIETGLSNSQGKCIVNSISLKEGEENFLGKAELIRRYGAAAVVMLFDEKGQADTFERKIEVARRSYDLLVKNGFPAEEIIFDPNILTIATGVAENDRFGLDFIKAVRWIKENLPGVHVSGGVSNLSFSFRGNNPIREALHSVFLYHAVGAGLDMAIVNSQMLKPYDEIEPELRELLEDLLFARREDSTERILDYASRHSADKEQVGPDTADTKIPTPEEMVSDMLFRGNSDGLNDCLAELQAKYSSGLEIIEKVLMPVMDEIGARFGEGRMFLPQVIKSARVLKQSITQLSESMSIDGGSIKNKGTVIAATVRGDIHDIGKNIVSLVAACSGFEVVDLGVMAEASLIAEKAERLKPVAVLLSGLITPSLNEMTEVCREFERRGLKVPVIVGGATTSALHTALKIAPVYQGIVIHSPDASCNSRYLSRLASPESEAFKAEIKKFQKKLREDYQNSKVTHKGKLSLEEARERALKKTTASLLPQNLQKIVLDRYDIGEVESLIDWNSFYASWEVKNRNNPGFREEKEKLLSDALAMLAEIKREGLLRLQAVAAHVPARGENEDLVLETQKGDVRLPMVRDLSAEGKGECVADFVAREDDYVCLFAVTAGVGLKKLIEKYQAEGNDYKSYMAKFVADRLAEAFSQKLQTMLFPGNKNACRMAFGYPSMPDHSMKKTVFELLDVEQLTDMRLTGNDMITPEESICGIILPEGHYFTPIQ